MTPTLDALVRQLRERIDLCAGSSQPMAEASEVATLLDALTAAQKERGEWQDGFHAAARDRNKAQIEAARLREQVQAAEQKAHDAMNLILDAASEQVSALQGELAEAQAKHFAAIVKCEEQALAESERLVAERDAALKQLAEARNALAIGGPDVPALRIALANHWQSLAMIEAERDAAREALRLIDHVDNGDGWYECPWCHANEERDLIEHWPSCARQAALGQPAEPQP